MSLFKRLKAMSVPEEFRETTLPRDTRIEIEGAALYLDSDTKVWMTQGEARKALKRMDRPRLLVNILRALYLIGAVCVQAALMVDASNMHIGVIPASSWFNGTPTETLIASLCVDMILLRVGYLCSLKAVNPFRRVSLLSF